MCVQHPYSLLNRRLEEELFGLVRDRGLGLMAYSPLAVGLLSGTYHAGQPAPAGTLWATRLRERYAEVLQGGVAEVVRTVQEIAGEVGKTPAQVALAWVLAHPEVTCAISGADSLEQLSDVLGAVGWALPPELRTRLDAVSATAPTVLA
jgi:aryl-alcohol dehydrogenase-like predicted oxidoreductase